MSAYKKLNRQDVFVSDYTAKKQWIASGSILDSYGIETLRGFSGSTPGYPYPNDLRNSRYEKLVFDSVNHNYYADGIGNGLFSGSRDLSLQSTLTLSGSRDIKTEVAVISIPKNSFGVHLEPGTISLKPQTDIHLDRFITGGYCQDFLSGVDQYVEDVEYWYGSNPLDNQDYIVSESSYIDESIDEYVDIDRGQQSLELIDDGNGALIYSGSELKYTDPRRVVGDVIYNQGQIIITDPEVARYYSTYGRHILQWKSNLPIYTYNVHCRVKDSEMNFTYNPSAHTGSFGQLANNVTGSDFTPYITTLGLYNDVNELLAVAKTNRPIPKSSNVDMTFIVKIDI